MLIRDRRKVCKTFADLKRSSSKKKWRLLKSFDRALLCRIPETVKSHMTWLVAKVTCNWRQGWIYASFNVRCWWKVQLLRTICLPDAMNSFHVGQWASHLCVHLRVFSFLTFKILKYYCILLQTYALSFTLLNKPYVNMVKTLNVYRRTDRAEINASLILPIPIHSPGLISQFQNIN